jgi:hypothetical protein
MAFARDSASGVLHFRVLGARDELDLAIDLKARPLCRRNVRRRIIFWMIFWMVVKKIGLGTST